MHMTVTNQAGNVDIQAQKILEGLQKLDQLLENPVAKEALDLGENAQTSRHYEILQRVRKSLRQYLERGGDLFYVGLIGHFSAGKSSTINSLLGLWGTKDERKTDLHPTDDEITLITQTKNMKSLLGVIKEGHVTIRPQPIESPLLDSLVLVDTPGSGDPRFIEEVARDFLPICDVILFLFSATSTLNKNDLPLLLELHKRLAFIPIQFVITRADELRRNFGEKLSDANFNEERKAQFLNGVVTRMNEALKPANYGADHFLLIDNLAPYNVDALRALLQARFNSSGTQARILMHTNKLHFYLTAARELRDFFARFLEAKLQGLSTVVSSAERNIQRYNEVVQISNTNLTHSWLDRHAALNSARDRTLDRLKRPPDLPEQYSAFSAVIKKRAEVSEDVARDARIAAQSIGARVRKEVLPLLQDHLGEAKRAVSSESLDKLSATAHGVPNITVAFDLNEVDFLDARRLAMRYEDLRSSEAGALRDSLSDLKSAAGRIEELLQTRTPFADFENVVVGAKDSLLADLDRFFHSVELYREGVFSLGAQEAVAALGIGGELQKLHTGFTDDVKSSFAADATQSLFPNFTEIRAKAATELTALSARVRQLFDDLRALKVERPGGISGALDVEVPPVRSQFLNDLSREMQADVDRLCERVTSALTAVLFTTRGNYDSAMKSAISARRRRYLFFILIAGILAFFGYLAFRHFKSATSRTLATFPQFVQAAWAQEPGQPAQAVPQSTRPQDAAPTPPKSSQAQANAPKRRRKSRHRKGRAGTTAHDKPSPNPTQTGQSSPRPATESSDRAATISPTAATGPTVPVVGGPPTGKSSGDIKAGSVPVTPTPSSAPPHEPTHQDSTLEVVAWGVLSELIGSGIGLLLARLRDRYPTTVHEIREGLAHTLKRDVARVIDGELSSCKFDPLNEANLASRLVRIYGHLIEMRDAPWDAEASKSLASLRILHENCTLLRNEYVNSVEETREQYARYFTDASKNLQILTSVADKIKKQTMVPSFALLDRTRTQLEYVKQETKAIDFA